MYIKFSEVLGGHLLLGFGRRPQHLRRNVGSTTFQLILDLHRALAPELRYEHQHWLLLLARRLLAIDLKK